MDLQNTPMTVQLGRGARIQLANAVIETGNTGATIQFGSVDFPAIIARASEAPTRRTHLPAQQPATEAPTRRVHLPAQRPTTKNPCGRIFVFERLSQPEALTTRRIVNGGRVSVVTANTTTLQTRLSAPGKYDAEASSSRGRPTRRQRRKMNAELRAQHQQLPVHPSNLSAQEFEANIPTQNGFANLKWVKRNSSTGELKKFFWDRRPEAPIPPRKKEPETLSARVYRVLKTVKDKGLKRKFQRPSVIETRRTPPRERLSFVAERREIQYTPRGEHRGVTPEPYVQGSTAERSRWKGKQVWRPKPRRNEKEDRRERRTDLGVTFGEASRRSAPIHKRRQKWAPKGTHNNIHPDGRHLGESSKGSRRPPSPPKEKNNFNRSPLIEEVPVPNQEPEIQWRRRSEIRVLEDNIDYQNIEEDEFLEDDENIQEYLEGDENIEENIEGNMEENIDEFLKENLEEEMQEINNTMDMEVVYMVRHTNVNEEVYYDDDEDDDNQQPTIRRVYQRRREAGSTTGRGGHSQAEEEREEAEENPFADENVTLVDMQRHIRRQMRAKDREISQLNEKMTEMMAQMGAMMQMMQRTVAVGAMPNPPPDSPNFQMPQVSGVRGTLEGGNEVHNVIRQPTPQNVASTSEPVTAAQLEGIITEKIKAIIAVDQAEKLVGKGRPYPAEYDQVPYPKGYSVPKFNTFNGNNNL